jgi:two-component system response regulator FixJ
MSSQFLSIGGSEFVAGTPVDMVLRSRPRSDREMFPESRAALIAIVDDDPWVLKSLDRLIKAAGFRTETFASAEDFMDAGDHREAACLILDLRLPGMSGLELQHHLVTERGCIPIVFVTAHDEPEARNKAMRAGAVAFFGKPFNDEALLDTVRSVVK